MVEEVKKAKEKKRDGKKQRSKRPVSKKWEYYESSGDKVDRKRRSCPKCGGGVFMAEHKDRLSCGSCGYTESPSNDNVESTPKKEPKPGTEQEEKKE